MRFFTLLFLMLFSASAYSATTYARWSYTGTTVLSDTPQLSCDLFISNRQATYGTARTIGFVSLVVNGVGYRCNYSDNVGGNSFVGINPQYVCAENPNIVVPSSTTCTTTYTPPVDCASKANTTLGDAYIQAGTTLAGKTARSLYSCSDGCELRPATIYDGIYSRTDASDGIIFLHANLKWTGQSCISGQSPPVTTLPDNVCASGDVSIQIAGKPACATPSPTNTIVKMVAPTVQISNPNPQTNPPSTTIQVQNNPVNPNTPSTTTTTSISYSTTGGVSSVSHSSMSTINNTYNGTDSNSIDLSGLTSQLAQQSTKLDTLNTKMTVEGALTSGDASTGSTGNNFYTTKYPNGITGIWNTAKNNVMASSIGSLMTNLTPNLGNGGGAPSWTFNVNLGSHMNFGSHTITTSAELWNILSIIFIITTLFVARGLIFGG